MFFYEGPELVSIDSKYSNPSEEELSLKELELKFYLETLKKEEYVLELQLKTWKKTLNEKLEKFKEVEVKLSGEYENVWKGRENFCNKADEFNDKYGILSNWWKAQLKYVFDLEKFKEKKQKEKKLKGEIAFIEKEIKDVKNELEELRMPKEITVAEIHVEPNQNFGNICAPKTEGDCVKKEGNIKKVRFMIDEEEIEPDEDTDYVMPNAKNKLFSLVDINRVRRMNRKKNKLMKATSLSSLKMKSWIK